MSILIRGMTRPKNCFECHLTKWIDDGCAGCVADDKIHNASKPVDCPLIEIPEPHGALIDRDAPEVVFCKDCRKHNVKVGFDENFHTVWKEDACPLVNLRGKAKEHEFDYQYCAFAERRTE